MKLFNVSTLWYTYAVAIGGLISCYINAKIANVIAIVINSFKIIK